MQIKDNLSAGWFKAVRAAVSLENKRQPLTFLPTPKASPEACMAVEPGLVLCSHRLKTSAHQEEQKSKRRFSRPYRCDR